MSRCCPTTETGLQFQNLFVNGEKYPKGFTEKAQSGEPLWSGCSGVGLGLPQPEGPGAGELVGSVPEVLRGDAQGDQVPLIPSFRK